MTPERWQRVKQLFTRALKQKDEDRASFLEQVCNGDEELRSEVESLLASFEESDHFIEMPVAGAAAEVFAELPPSLVGRRLGHYEILTILGEGGVGEVYLAQDTRLDRRVALKVLSATSVSNPEANERFWREARAAATLDDPHICAIHEITEVDGCCFIVMQYLEGETLAAKLKNKRLNLREVVNVAVQVIDALAVAHEANIVHRDIKPANIMVNSKGHVKVLDFGLAKFVEDNLEINESSPSLSKSGAIMGTIPFMSPEQVRGTKLDARTDIFSFGATLYEMCCGKNPFRRDSDAETISAILRDEPVWDEVAPALRPIVKKCLRKDVDQRYETALAVSADLAQVARMLSWGPDQSNALQTSGSGSIEGANGDRINSEKRTLVSISRSITTQILRHRLVSVIVLLAVVTSIAVVGYRKYFGRFNAETQIETIAVLPLRSLTPDAKDQYLGLAIADSIIAKISRTQALRVRPTSAVRKYTNQDALQAARELQADAVLDGTYLRVGDQLRITVNLLRVSDGTSLWADTFDQRFTDIFAIQDEVSQQIAQRLRLTTNSVEQARLKKRNTSNPEAYNYYAKGMYHFYNIGPNLNSRSESDLAVDLFKKAIELDPGYALAHAHLGYAYTKMAVFQEDNPGLIEQAKQHLGHAERIDPQMAEVHLARYFILFSQYEGWQVEPAARELRVAQQLSPDVGHAELGDLWVHIGLEEQAAKEYELALKFEPNNQDIRNGYVNSYFISGRPDEGLEASKRFRVPNADLMYFLEKRMVQEAEPLVEQQYQRDPSAVWKFVFRVLLLSVKGKHQQAQASVPSILARERRYRGYHHDTYNIARIYALDGKSKEAVKWLRVTANEGFPCYPLFARDTFLDSIRQDPSFLQFIDEQKQRWEGYKRVFG